MSKIEFRVWDKENNKYWEDVNEAYNGKIEQLFIGPSGEVFIRTMNGMYHESKFTGRFVVQQYTGLKDHTGKRIYDYDNVKFRKYTKEYSGTVHLEKGCFIVKWESVVGAYGEKATHSEYLKNCENVEVINP